MEAGRELQFFDITGTNVLANEVVQHFFNLTTKECWESEKRVLWQELLILTHQSTRRDSIYKIGKARKHFIDELARRGSPVRAESSISLTARF